VNTALGGAVPAARFALPLGALLGLVAMAPPAWAVDEALRDGRSEGRAAYRTKQHGAMEIRFGPYRPDVDEEFGGTATPWADIYGTGDTVMFGLEGDWQAIRIPHFGTFGPGLQVSFATFSQYALLEADPSQRSQQPTNTWFLPVSLLAVLRIDVFAREFKVPLAPYVKFGGTMTLWENTDGMGVASVPDPANPTGPAVGAQGISTGLTGAAGLMIWLNPIAPQAALDMDNSTGVNNAYLFGEWMLSRVSSFDEGLETGDSTWQVGVTLEF